MFICSVGLAFCLDYYFKYILHPAKLCTVGSKVLREQVFHAYAINRFISFRYSCVCHTEYHFKMTMRSVSVVKFHRTYPILMRPSAV